MYVNVNVNRYFNDTRYYYIFNSLCKKIFNYIKYSVCIKKRELSYISLAN